MKNLLIFALSFISTVAFSQNQNSLLYKISGKGITKPSYIFGTIHISCDATIDAATRKALDATTQMYLELDMDDPEMQSKMMKTMIMKDGITLNSLLSEADYKILDAYLLEKMKVPVTLFDTYKPFILSATFMSTLLDCAPQSFETELIKISTLQKEPIFGLETVEEQMAVFDTIPYKVQIEEVIKSIKNDFKDDKIELNLMLDAYANKDLNKLKNLMSNSKSAMMTDYEDIFLSNRNKNWVKLIPKISKEKPTFYGVGAAHLFGKEGVLDLLGAEGYEVEAVVN